MQTTRTRQLECGILMLVIAAFVGLLQGGCAKKEIQPWVAPPQTTWSDVSTVSVAPLGTCYQLLSDQPTKGVFPATVSITRMAVKEHVTRNGPTRRIHLVRDPRNEFLQWNFALDDLFAVSEVFPVTQFDLGGAPADPEQVLSAMRALHAGIGIIYAVNELTEEETEMFATIYDLRNNLPIAVIRAQAKSTFPPEEDQKKEPVDYWKHDARARVRRKFEKCLHTCIGQLILRDEPVRVDPPEGWIPIEPARPAKWPPPRQSGG